MTPYSYHEINTQNQADRLRQRDEIRLAARVSAGAATRVTPAFGARGMWLRQALHGVLAVLTQPIRL